MGEARTISLWAALIVVPVGLVGGWAVGRFSDPKPPVVDVASEASLFPGSGGTAPPREFSVWTTMPSALEESQRTGKPILIDFSAEWCPPCQAMSRTVFESSEYSEVVQLAVIPVSLVDRVREDGRNTPEIDQLQARFDVQAFPTLVVLNPKTGKSVQVRGFGGPEATTQWIAQAVVHVK